MDAPVDRPALFRFDGPAADRPTDAPGPSDEFAPPGLPADEADRPAETRSTAAWLGPVLAFGVTVAATAGLALAVMAPGEDRQTNSKAVPTPGGGVILTGGEAAAGPTEADMAADGSDVDEEPVVTALHVWDGRPIRAVPTDTLPANEAAVPRPGGSFGAVAPAGGVVPAGGVAPAAAPAVWLTGEIAD